MYTKSEQLKHAEEVRRKQDFAGAVELLATVLNEHGPDAQVLRLIGSLENHLFLASGDQDSMKSKRLWESACRHLSEAIALEPQNADHHVALAFVLWMANPPQSQTALDTYRRALTVEPLCWEALASIVFFWSDPDVEIDTGEAIRCGELALRIRPTHGLWHEMARLYRYVGRVEDSERATMAMYTELRE